MEDCCRSRQVAEVASNSRAGWVLTEVLLEIVNAFVLYQDGRKLLRMLSCFHGQKVFALLTAPVGAQQVTCCRHLRWQR